MHCWAAAGSEPEQSLAWLLCLAASAASGSRDPCQAAGHRTQQSRMAAGQHSLAQVTLVHTTTQLRLCNSLLVLGRKAPDQLSCGMVHINTLSHRWMGLCDCLGVGWVWSGSSPTFTQRSACCLTSMLWVAAERQGPGRRFAPAPAGGGPAPLTRSNSSRTGDIRCRAE